MRQPTSSRLQPTWSASLLLIGIGSTTGALVRRASKSLVEFSNLSLPLNASHLVEAGNSSSIRRNNSRLDFGNRRLVPDHGWAEVMRFATACGPAAEGYSVAFPNDCGPDYVKMGRPELASCDPKHPPAKVGYGCWFFFAEGPLVDNSFYWNAGVKLNSTAGSGVSVNVGRSLRFDTRGAASAALDLPCGDPPLCEKPGTVQDKLYCERAVERGYDSIQFAHPHSTCLEDSCVGQNPAELLLCTGSCMSERITQACPPGLKLRRVGTEGPCECSTEAHVLNCGAGAPLYGRRDHGRQRCPADMGSPTFHKLMTAPELYEFFIHLCNPEQMPHIQAEQHKARVRMFAAQRHEDAIAEEVYTRRGLRWWPLRSGSGRQPVRSRSLSVARQQRARSHVTRADETAGHAGMHIVRKNISGAVPPDFRQERIKRQSDSTHSSGLPSSSADSALFVLRHGHPGLGARVASRTSDESS